MEDIIGVAAGAALWGQVCKHFDRKDQCSTNKILQTKCDGFYVEHG